MDVRRDVRVAGGRVAGGEVRAARRGDPGPAVPPATESVGDVSPEAVEFVRFCYRRRAVGWPQLYDEMSAVAARCEFRGWGYGELADHGIEFTLTKLPRLAALAGRVAREERAGRSTSI